MKLFKSLVSACALVLSLLALAFTPGSALADIVPTYVTFGALTGETFGGKSIPNTPAAVTYYTDASDTTLTMGLIATARGASNPSPSNDGAGTYYAINGIDTGTTNDARWNFDFFMGGSNVDSYVYELIYSINGEEYFVNPLAYFTSAQEVNHSYQQSGNLALLPTGGLFDAGAAGQYGLELAAYSDANGALVEVADVAIVIDVADVVNVPEPSSIALVGIALLAAIGVTRRRRG